MFLVRFVQDEFSVGFLNFQGCHSFSPFFGAGGLDIKTD